MTICLINCSVTYSTQKFEPIYFLVKEQNVFLGLYKTYCWLNAMRDQQRRVFYITARVLHRYSSRAPILRLIMIIRGASLSWQ